MILNVLVIKIIKFINLVYIYFILFSEMILFEELYNDNRLE